MNLSKPKIVFAATSHIKKIRNACKGMKNIKRIVVIEGRHLSEFITCLKDFIKINSSNDFNLEKFVKTKVDLINQPAMIMCSSGTTGKCCFFLNFNSSVHLILNS